MRGDLPIIGVRGVTRSSTRCSWVHRRAALRGITAAKSIRWLARLFDAIGAETVDCPQVADPPDGGWMDRA